MSVIVGQRLANPNVAKEWTSHAHDKDAHVLAMRRTSVHASSVRAHFTSYPRAATSLWDLVTIGTVSVKWFDWVLVIIMSVPLPSSPHAKVHVFQCVSCCYGCASMLPSVIVNAVLSAGGHFEFAAITCTQSLSLGIRGHTHGEGSKRGVCTPRR